MDGNEVVDAFARGELVHLLVDGNEVVLEEAVVLTSPAQKSGFVAQTDAGVTVVLDTNLTPELVRRRLCARDRLQGADDAQGRRV